MCQIFKPAREENSVKNLAEFTKIFLNNAICIVYMRIQNWDISL